MDPRSIGQIWPGVSITEGQVSKILNARKAFGRIPTFFGGYSIPIGIEVEVEGYSTAGSKESLPNMYWGVHSDGSLKDFGAEFISVPISGHNIDYAWHELQTYLEKMKVKTSHRCSIHHHVDVSQWTQTQLDEFIALYALVEDLLFSLHTDNRYWNPYCYPICSLQPKDVSFDEEIKYCALNPAPVPRQNTIEFRHADFSLDFRKNRRWTQILCKLVRFGHTNRDKMRGIIQNTIEKGKYEELFEAVFDSSVFLFAEDGRKAAMEKNALWSLTYLEESN